MLDLGTRKGRRAAGWSSDRHSSSRGGRRLRHLPRATVHARRGSPRWSSLDGALRGAAGTGGGRSEERTAGDSGGAAPRSAGTRKVSDTAHAVKESGRRRARRSSGRPRWRRPCVEADPYGEAPRDARAHTGRGARARRQPHEERVKTRSWWKEATVGRRRPERSSGGRRRQDPPGDRMAMARPRGDGRRAGMSAVTRRSAADEGKALKGVASRERRHGGWRQRR